MAELIEKHANGGKANFVGHSLGAKIIIELLSIKPELILKAIVASALFRPIPLMKLTHKPFYYKLTTDLLKSTWITSLLVKQFKFPNKIYNDNCKRGFQGLSAQTFYRIYDEVYKNIGLPKGLEKVEVPTLIIAGEREPKAMKQSVIDMINVIPNSKGILIKNGQHTYPWVMYESFNKIIDEWINNEQIISESVVHLS